MLEAEDAGVMDPRARRLLDMLAAVDGGGGRTDIAAQRAGLDQLAVMAAGPGAEVADVRDVSIDGPGGALTGRLYDPSPGAWGGALLYLHGGGWVAGGLQTHDSLCRALAAGAGRRILALDYRRAPEHPFPAAELDGLAALDWLRDRAGALAIDPSRLGVGGDSAGGGIAAGVCLRSRDRGDPPLALQLLICPILDLVGTSPSRRAFETGFFIDPSAFDQGVRAYLPQGMAPNAPGVSPMRRTDLAGSPPTRVHTAEFDPFRDEGEAFAGRLCAAGVPARVTRHAGMIHYFYALAGAIPAGRAAVAAMAQDIREALTG